MGSCVLAEPQIWTLEEVPGEEHPGRGYSGRVGVLVGGCGVLVSGRGGSWVGSGERGS